VSHSPAYTFIPPVDSSRVRLGYGRFVSANLRLLVMVQVILVVLFALTRIGLIWRNWTPDVAPGHDLVRAFLVGLRFDFAIACYLTVAMMIWCYIPWVTPWRSNRARKIFLWTWTAINGAIAFTLLAEFEFFREFQSRFNELAIRYLNHPKTVGGMIWYDYPVVRYVLAAGVLTALSHVALRYALKVAGRNASPEGSIRTINWPLEIGGATLVVVIIAIGARGGFQSEPIRWGDAFKGPNEFTNQMSLNGIYCLVTTGREMLTRGQTSGRWAGKMNIDEARSIVRELVVAPGEKLLDDKRRTVYREGEVGSSLVLHKRDGRPMNVVVVLMESFSGRYVGAMGAKRSFSPAFDTLAQDGVLFDRVLSAGSHTHQAIFTTHLGFPNLPGYETLMESGIANQHFQSASEIFQESGYHTMFLYNGDFAWDNMRGFFQKQGIDKFIGGAEMKDDAKYLDAVWGVSDGDLFDRANREFEAADKKGPFFAAVLTLSNHSPFQVPPVPGASPITDQGEYNGRLTAMRYADWAVGKFVEDAKKLSYFKNTLFVFMGDHGFHVPPVLTEVHLLYHHVPLLFYAPGMIEPRVDHRVGTNMNVIPSILGLLGDTDKPHASWGRSLFNDSFPDENFAIFKMSGGGRAVAIARGDDLLVLGTATGKPTLLKYNLGPNPTIRPQDNPALEKRMERELRAYVQCALDDLLNHRAGPTNGD
jgi:phosphoglycerol transferase MdoB-like AlkP superfamily enzyme